MDPLEPWVDVASVRRMAEQLMAASPLPAVEDAPDAGFGSDFIGYAPSPVPLSASAPVVQRAYEPEPVREVRASPPVERADVVVEPAPMVSPFQPVEPPPLPPVAVVAPPPLVVPEAAPANMERRGPLMDRLVRFREGLVRYTGAQGVFILDREGKPVMDDMSFGKLYFLARSLAQAYRPVAGQPGNVHVKINANLILEVIPVDTPFGCLVLGAVVSQPLTAHVVGEIAVALLRAATPGDSANGAA